MWQIKKPWNRIRIEMKVLVLEGKIKMEEISNSRMMVIWWNVSDSAQYENSCPVMFVFFSETCRDKRSFSSNQIKVLVSVLLKNTSNTLLTYCYLWKPQRWKNKIIALFYHNCFFAMVNSYLIVYCAITCYILGVKFSPGNLNIIIIM